MNFELIKCVKKSIYRYFRDFKKKIPPKKLKIRNSLNKFRLNQQMVSYYWFGNCLLCNQKRKKKKKKIKLDQN